VDKIKTAASEPWQIQTTTYSLQATPKHTVQNPVGAPN
jgi:hypothetical protein